MLAAIVGGSHLTGSLATFVAAFLNQGAVWTEGWRAVSPYFLRSIIMQERHDVTPGWVVFRALMRKGGGH